MASSAVSLLIFFYEWIFHGVVLKETYLSCPERNLSPDSKPMEARIGYGLLFYLVDPRADSFLDNFFPVLLKGV